MTKSSSDAVLTQWKTCVEMANSVSQRRDSMNKIFITINIAIVSAVSFVWNTKSLFLLCTGVAICILWILLIRNYKILNAAKFNFINDIEQQLPLEPFNVEWKYLKKNKYVDTTYFEFVLASIFIILYFIAIVTIVLMCISKCGM